MLIARSRLHRLAILIFLLPLASALWQRDPLSAPRELLKSASAGNLIAFAGGADPCVPSMSLSARCFSLALFSGGGADSAAIDFYDASQPGLMLPRLNLTMPRPYTRHYAVGASTAGSSLYFHIGTGRYVVIASYFHFTAHQLTHL